MADHDTPARDTGAPASPAAAMQEPDETGTTASNGATPDGGGVEPRRNRDWIIPVAALAGLLFAVSVFFVGFFVGRATGDSDAAGAPGHVAVRVVPGDRAPNGDGFGFRDFGRGGPRERFDNPDLIGPLGDLEQLPTPRLDRLCTFLDDGSIPDEAPFIDELRELCTSLDA